MPLEPGPVFRYETRRLAGRRGSYAFRVALTMILAANFVLAQELFSRFAEFGYPVGDAHRLAVTSYSGIIAAVGILAAFLVAPIPALSTFSRRRGKFMLPLLLVTRLSAREIIWQSFAACMIPGLFLLVCMFPFVAFLVRWWGLDPVYMAIVATTILGSMAVCVALAAVFSLWSRGTLSAAFAAYAASGAWLYGTLLLAATAFPPARWVSIANPLLLIWPGQPGQPTIGQVALFACGSAFVTIALLEIATATFRRSILARESTRSRKPPRVLAALHHATGRRPAWWPRPTLDGNPVLWCEWRHTQGSLGVQAFWFIYVLGAAIATLMGARAYWAGAGVQPVLAPVAGYELGIGILALAVQASLVWSEEMSAGREGVDLLLATPLPAATIVNGKWWAVYRFIVPVLLFPVLASLLVIVDAPASPRLEPGPWNAFTQLVTVPLVLAQVLLYAAAFVSLGVFLATRCTKPAQAVIWTLVLYVAVALIVPTVAELMFLPLNRPLAAGLALASPIAAPIAVIMTRFPGPYFLPAEFVFPIAAIWLLVAAGVALVLHQWTIHRFDRWLGRIPSAGDRRSRFATDPRPAPAE
jgi:ABC-type transport system involved in multi-copper enzyme maturation permease subunit